MESIKQCKTEWGFDPIIGWKLKLSGDCADIKEKIESLPKRKREYLKRRIELKTD